MGNLIHRKGRYCTMKSPRSTSPQTALKLNHTALLRITGYLHALALFWCFYPLAARLFLAETTFRTPFLLTGIFLLFPVILSWYAATKLKYLILYFLTGILVSMVFWAPCLTFPFPWPQGFPCPAPLCSFSFGDWDGSKKGRCRRCYWSFPLPI